MVYTIRIINKFKSQYSWSTTIREIYGINMVLSCDYRPAYECIERSNFLGSKITKKYYFISGVQLDKYSWDKLRIK